MAEVGSVTPGGASRGPDDLKRVSPTDAKIKRQAINIPKNSRFESGHMPDEMTVVQKKSAEEIAPARKVLGSEADKRVVARANELLEKPIPPSKEALEFLRNIDALEVTTNKSGDVELKVKLFRSPAQITKEIGKKSKNLDDLTIIEVFHLLQRNPTLKRAFEAGTNRSIDESAEKLALQFPDKSIETIREEIRKSRNEDLARLESLYQEKIAGEKLQLCVRLIDESGGKLHFNGSKFELNYNSGSKAHLATFEHLFAKYKYTDETPQFLKIFLEQVLSSPVLSPLLKTREFWETSCGEEILKLSKKTRDIFYDATPRPLVLQLLDSCGDSLKIESSTSAGHTMLSLAVRKEGEKSNDMQMVLEMIADKDRPQSQNKETLERMGKSTWVNSVCEKAGLGSFEQLNETLAENAKALGDALQPVAQERIGQLKQFLITERGKEWGAENCNKIGENEAIFSPLFDVQAVASKTNDDGTTSSVVTLQATPRWCYIGDESSIKTYSMNKNEPFLAPFTITVELAKSPVSSSNDAKPLLDLVREETIYETVFISPDRKKFDSNFNSIVAAVQYNLLPVVEELTAKAGGDRDNFTMHNEYKLHIEKRADGKANVTVEITPRYHLGHDYSNAPLTDLEARKIELILPDLESKAWESLEIQLRLHMDDHENGDGGGSEAVTIAYLETLNVATKDTPIFTNLRERQRDDYESQRGVLTTVSKAAVSIPENIEERLQALKDFEAEQTKTKSAETEALDDRLKALRDFEEDLKSGIVLPDAPTGVPQPQKLRQPKQKERRALEA